MRHIVIGMAKSSLDTRGSKARNLELDFLRMLYTSARLEAAGHEVSTYLAVADEAVRVRTDAWAQKYDAADRVMVFVPRLTDEEQSELEAEKRRNAKGNVKEAKAEEADASYGRALLECYLKQELAKRHPGIMGEERTVFGISWDFYGESPRETPAQVSGRLK